MLAAKEANLDEQALFDRPRERVAAAIFDVACRATRAARPFTAINWLKRLQETGGVASVTMVDHKPKAIPDEHCVFVLQRIQRCDFTLRALSLNAIVLTPHGGERNEKPSGPLSARLELASFVPKYSPGLNSIEQALTKLEHLDRPPRDPVYQTCTSNPTWRSGD